MANQHVLQVSEFTKKVKFLLESELNTVWLCGEISNFISASSGHWYLSLKDCRSQVRCAMFKGTNRRVKISPKNGQQVLVRAKVSLYEPRGDFQLIIEQMDDAGSGLLQQQYEQLKQKLSTLGYFSQTAKQAIPTHIQTIGIITSPTGAAVKDILTVLKRRSPNTKAIIYPAVVQGDLAPAALCKAISQANERNECQVIIVGRGGGSLEDLWCFNDENVVKAIYQSQLPIISAVGHEIDTTLADYVADLRAPTPSAAAEMVSADNESVMLQISQFQRRLIHSINLQLQQHKIACQNISQRLLREHPAHQLHVQQQKYDELSLRLVRCIHQKQSQLMDQPKQLSQRLLQCSPSKPIELALKKAEQLNHHLTHHMQTLLTQKQNRFASLVEKLHIVSPLATLSRGYAIARDENKKIIRSVEQVSTNEEVYVQFSDGTVKVKVKGVV